METKASAKYIRISPRKARLVVDLIRGRDVGDAQQILDYSPKGAARVVAKILNSAIANAEHNNGLDPDELYVCGVYVDEGPTLKRFRPRALGRATRINKRTSHITLVLDEREPRPESKRRRFRRPVRKKAAAEPEIAEGEELEEGEGEEEEEEEEALEVEPVEAAEPQAEAAKPPRSEADKVELNADVEADQDVAEPPQAAEPEAQPQADAVEAELNSDTKAKEAKSDTKVDKDVKDTKAKRKPKDKKPKAKKTKKPDDSESED